MLRMADPRRRRPGVEADEARSTSDLRGSTPVFDGHRGGERRRNGRGQGWRSSGALDSRGPGGCPCGGCGGLPRFHVPDGRPKPFGSTRSALHRLGSISIHWGQCVDDRREGPSAWWPSLRRRCMRGRCSGSSGVLRPRYHRGGHQAGVRVSHGSPCFVDAPCAIWCCGAVQDAQTREVSCLAAIVAAHRERRWLASPAGTCRRPRA